MERLELNPGAKEKALAPVSFVYDGYTESFTYMIQRHKESVAKWHAEQELMAVYDSKIWAWKEVKPVRATPRISSVMKAPVPPKKNARWFQSFTKTKATY